MRVDRLVTFGGVMLLALAASGSEPPSRTAPATQPARVNLDLTNAPAADAIQALSQAVGEPLLLSPPDLLKNNDLPRVTLHLKQATFWDSLKEIGRQTGIEPILQPEDASSPRLQLGLGKGIFWKSPHALAGPLAIFPVEVERSVTVELGKPRHRTDRSMHVSLVAYSQPGLRVLGVDPTVQVKQALDEQGRSLMPGADDASGDGGADHSGALLANGSSSWDLTALLKCPGPGTKTIATLRGKATVRVQTRSQRLEVENILKARNVSRMAGGVAVTIKNCKKNEGEYILHISLKRGQAADGPWNDLKQSISSGGMALYDQKGRLVARGSEEGGDSNERSVDSQVHFVRDPTNAGEPFKLVWDAPVEAADVSVEFDLSRLPVPE